MKFLICIVLLSLITVLSSTISALHIDFDEGQTINPYSDKKIAESTSEPAIIIKTILDPESKLLSLVRNCETLRF